jgi:hypothetical protein
VVGNGVALKFCSLSFDKERGVPEVGGRKIRGFNKRSSWRGEIVTQHNT